MDALAGDELELHELGRRPAVSAIGVHKTFVLPHQRNTTVKERLLRPFAADPFEPLPALSDVSFEVARGEFFGVIGRNGSGKSTLLRCLAGIYPVDAGSVSVEGRVVPFIELGVGFNAELPARDNIVTNAIVLGLSRKEAADRVDDVLEFAELEPFADQKLKNFSTGMGVRLAFAVAVHVDADVFFFDEVLAVGDAGFREKCAAHFERLRSEGKTVVLVTHDVHFVKQSCDRALLLDRGRILELGSPEAVAERYDELNASPRPATTPAASVPVRTSRPVAYRSLLLGSQPRRIGTLVRLLASNNFKLKYLDARLSYLWAVARPLALFGIMLVVFSKLGRFDNGVRHYPVLLLLGIVLWTFYGQATEGGLRSLVQRADFLRKLPFPHLAVPIAQVAVSLVDLAANGVVVIAFALAFGVTPTLGWLEMIPLILLLAVFASGFALLLSAAYVRHRDLDQIWSVVLQTTFFCTPIVFVLSTLPAPWERIVVLVNPVATILTEARHAFVDPTAQSAAAAAGGAVYLLIPLGIVVAVVALGLWMLRRESPWAAESV